MGVRKAIGRSVKNKFNVKKMAGGDQVVENAHLIKDMAKEVFERNNEKAKTFHRFEDAARYYGLSEAALKKRRKNCLIMAAGFVLVALALVVYSIYLFSQPLIIAGFTTLLLAAVAGLLAFREHLTFYQLTTRRLKLSMKEWLGFLLSKQGCSL